MCVSSEVPPREFQLISVRRKKNTFISSCIGTGKSLFGISGFNMEKQLDWLKTEYGREKSSFVEAPPFQECIEEEPRSIIIFICMYRVLPTISNEGKARVCMIHRMNTTYYTPCRMLFSVFAVFLVYSDTAQRFSASWCINNFNVLLICNWLVIVEQSIWKGGVFSNKTTTAAKPERKHRRNISLAYISIDSELSRATSLWKTQHQL